MSEQQQPIPWRELVAVLHRRRLLIAEVFVAGVVTVAIGIWLNGPTYRAVGRLMVTSDRAKVAVSPDADTRPFVDRVTEEDLNSEATLLNSEVLIREVLQPYYDAKQPEQPPTFFSHVTQGMWRALTLPIRLPGLLYRWLHNIPMPTDLDNWVESTSRHLSVSPAGRSNLIEIAFDSDNPTWSARVVNALIARHIEHHSKLNQQSEAREFYEKQRELLAQKSAEAEAALQQFYQREKVDPTAEQRTALRARLAELQTTLANSETELAEATARIKFLSTEIKNHPRSIATEEHSGESPATRLLKPKIMDLEMQRSQLLATYLPTSVKVKDIERQIAEAKRVLHDNKDAIGESTTAVNPTHQTLEVDLAQTQATVAAVGARVDSLRSQIAEYRERVNHLDTIAAEQEHLEQELAAAKQAYGTYAKKEEEARFSSALDDSRLVNIAIAEPAAVPSTPEKSKSLIIFGVGTLLSLLCGIGVAFLRDRLDPAVKSAAEAHGVTGLPILAEVSS